jgi:ribonuclease HI
MPNKGGPRPTRRQFVCPDPLWDEIVEAAGEGAISQWLREAAQEKLNRAADAPSP